MAHRIYDTRTALAQTTTAEILLIHGTLDNIVPVRHGRDLAAVLGRRCTWLEIPGVGHNDLLLHPVVRRALSQFLCGS